MRLLFAKSTGLKKSDLGTGVILGSSLINLSISSLLLSFPFSFKAAFSSR
jgi:hypothetical protein